MTDGTVKWNKVTGEGHIFKITMDWVSGSSSGNVADTWTKPVFGQVVQITTNPDGTDAPTAGYSIIISDEDGEDLGFANTTSLSATSTERFFPTIYGTAANNTDIQCCIAGMMTVTITGAGNSKKGHVAVYLRG